MSDIIAFDFEGAEVRTVYKGDEPWFVAIDVCEALGLSNSRMILESLDDDEKDDVSLTDAIGRKQNLNIINESGLYILILRSRNAVKPGTLQHRFRKWITSEVLPSIRKVGRYAAQETNTASTIEHQPASYRVFEAIIRPDGSWGKIWAIPVYRLDDVDYWNVPLLLEAISGSKEIPSHINPRQFSYNLMQEHADLPGAEPLRVASYRQLTTLVPAAVGYLDKRTRELLQMIQNTPLKEITRRGNNVVHLRDVTPEKP